MACTKSIEIDVPRRVASDTLPGIAARRQAEDALAIRADPESTGGIACDREHMHAPSRAVRERGERGRGGLSAEGTGGERQPAHEQGRASEHRSAGAKVNVSGGPRRSQSTRTVGGRVAMKSTASATSAGLEHPGPRGEAFPVIRIERIPDRGIRRPWRQQREADPAAAVLRQQGLVEPPKSELAGGVGGVLREARVIGHAAHRDVAAGTPRRVHARQERPGQREWRAQVDRDLGIELGVGRLGERPEQEAAGVADDDVRDADRVEPSAQRRDLRGVGEVGGNVDVFRRGVERARHPHHPRPGAPERSRRRRTDPAGRARHQRERPASAVTRPACPRAPGGGTPRGSSSRPERCRGARWSPCGSSASPRPASSCRSARLRLRPRRRSA